MARYTPGRRFAACRALPGEASGGRVLPAEAANPAPPPFFREVVGCAHGVVTAHLVDTAGHPTVRARDEIIAFPAERLSPRRRRHAEGAAGWGAVQSARSRRERAVSEAGSTL